MAVYTCHLSNIGKRYRLEALSLRPAWARLETPSEKQSKSETFCWGVAQMVEHLFKREAWGPIPGTAKTNKQNK
jgi:hypothetical protein